MTLEGSANSEGVAEPPHCAPPKAIYRKGDFSVVISGVSGRFPESASVDEFAENLFANVDLFTEDNRRWPTELFDMNQRMGKIPHIEHFDGKFFNYGVYGGAIDPGARLLLETTYEAICDAGVNPASLRGSSTGVYVGISTIAMPDGLPNIVDPLSAGSHYENIAWMNGCAKNMYANRLSYFFDFRGPSLLIDTACSASMVALDTAVTDLLAGKIEQAIVAGAHVNLQSFASYNMQESRIISRDGISKVWDIDADGFVKGEAVVSLFLQRQPDAKRIYARVLHIRTNIDGYKMGGPTYPSSERQRDLLIQTYTEADIHPNELTYFEAHGTGTKAGDYQEALAIQQAYQARSSPLPIGLLKSNIGHTEGTAGVASVVKVLIAYERECIPANLNMKVIKPEIKELTLLQSVTSNLKYTPGIVGVNSSGIGGVNGHALLEPNYKTASKTVPIATVSLPRLVPLHGRTQEAVEHLMSYIEGNPDKITVDFLGLIADVFKSKTLVYSDGFPYRGTLLITSEQVNGEDKLTYNQSAIESVNQQVATPLCFFYSGIGGQAAGLAKNLTSFNWFMDKLTPLSALMQPYGVDLIHLLTSESAEETIANSLVAKFVSTTAFQLILTDLLVRDLHLAPDCTLGHSFGEISAAFAKGHISAEEALLVSYHRGVVLEQARDKIPVGLMAAVGMSASEATERCPENVFLACDNAPKLVTLSGEEAAMKSFLARLSEDGIFVRQLDSAQFPLHTPFLEVIKEQLLDRLSSVFASTRQSTSSFASSDVCKWISTSQTAQFMLQLQANRGASESFSTLLAQYFVDNLLQPVQFKSAIESLDGSTVVLEIAGRELFEKVLGKAEKPFKYVPLIRGNARTAQGLLTNLGALYRQGFNPSIERLYPAVQWPVPRGTPSISSLLKWDHSESFHVKRSPDYYFKGTASDLLIEIDPKVPEYSYLFDHIIDGRAICPATMYLFLAWRRLAESRALPWTKVAVQFEQVQLKRAVFLDPTKVTILKVRLLYPSGEFTIFEGNNVCCTGLIRELPPGRLLQQEILERADQLEAGLTTLEHEDLYANMHIRGYEYGRQFCQLMSYSTDHENHSVSRVRWTGQIVCFLDHLLQVFNAVTEIREVFVPFLIQTLKIDPNVFFAAVEQAKRSKTELKEGGLPEVERLSLGRQEERDKLMEERSKSATEPLLPVYRNVRTEATVAPGIEMSKVVCIMLNRAMHPKPVVIDRYLFLRNHETLLLGKETTDHLDWHHYERLTTLASNRLLEQLGRSKTANLPFGASVDETSEERFREQFQNSKQACLFKMVSASLEKSNQQQGKASEMAGSLGSVSLSSLLGESALKLSSSLAGDFEVLEPSLVRRHLLAYVHSDLLSTLTYTERLLRPLVDLVAENFAFATKLTILQMSPVSAVPLAVKVDHYLASTTVLKKAIDYTLVSPQTGGELPLGFSKLNWSPPKEPLWPEGLPLNQAVQCTILYDDPFLQELQLTSGLFWEKVSQLLGPNGFVLLLLRSKLTPIERFLCEALFTESMPTDESLQERVKQICQCAQEAGFISVASKTASSGQMALLFRKKQPVNAPFSVVHLKDDSSIWLEEVKEKLAKAENGSQEIIWLLADGQTFPGALGFFNCLRQETEGKQFRLLFLPNAPQGQAEKAFSLQQESLLVASLAVNVVKKGVSGTYRHLSSTVITGSRLSREYHLNFGSNGYEVGNLSLYDLTNYGTYSSVPRIGGPPPLERKYAVYSAGLNFRDLMFASGRLRLNFDMLQLNSILGIEFAGRDCLTGERVFGIDLGGSFASTTYVEPALVRPIPPHWSYDEAAGIGVIYFTVWYGLIYRARLERGSTVLIHSAAGGVGQAALNICKSYDCTIFATVGNAEKRQFLVDQFSLPPEHIFSSRDCTFEREILRLTGGIGVKYVLNSLVGELLDASLRLVAYNGHFIELAKVEMAMNKRIGLYPFLSNISYHGVSNEFEMNSFGKKRSPVMGLFFDWLLGNCAPNQAVQPIKTQVYPLEEGATALRLMASGKHMGKIVLKLPREEESANSGAIFAPCKPLSVQTMAHFDPRKMYILVGGCGGVGLELVHWMVKRGAKRIVLTSRSPTRTAYQATVLGVIAKTGIKYRAHSNEITVYSEGDLSREEDVRAMVEGLTRDGSSIGGIFHLAAQLNDVPLKGMTPELWQKTVDSKATVGLHLDRVSREMLPQLDYFVCFSSISSGLGLVGQANYGYANAVLDQICQQRHDDGLHGLSLQYGPIDDVGMLRDKAGSIEMTIFNVYPQRIRSCLDVLDRALGSDCPVVSSFVYANRTHESAFKDGISRLAQMCLVMRINLETLPDSLPLEELGLDSLFAIELQTTIEQEFAINITLPEIMSMTIGQLKSARQKENHGTIKRQLGESAQMKKYLGSLSYTLELAPLEALNSGKDGPPLYLLPGGLSLTPSLRALAGKLHFPVCALPLTQELVNSTQLSSVHSIAAYYREVLLAENPTRRHFNLLAFDSSCPLALAIISSAPPGLSSHKLCIIEKESSAAWGEGASEQDDAVIDFLIGSLLAGSGQSDDSLQIMKERLLRSAKKEGTLKGKVKAISGLLIGYQLNKEKGEEVEAFMEASIRRMQTVAQEERKLGENKESLPERWLTSLSNTKSHLLLMRDALSPAPLYTHLKSIGEVENSVPESTIKMHQLHFEENAVAEMLNKFYQV